MLYRCIYVMIYIYICIYIYTYACRCCRRWCACVWSGDSGVRSHTRPAHTPHSRPI